MVDDGSAEADRVNNDTYESGSFDSPKSAPFIDRLELMRWTFYRNVGVEFVATLLFVYITISTVIGNKQANSDPLSGGVGVEGIAWAFGGTIFVLVYCTAGVSGGHINPAVTFGLFVARKLTVPCTLLYIVAQCLGAIVGAGLVKGRQKSMFNDNGGGANLVSHGYTKGDGLLAEIIGTFLLVYCVMSATDPKKKARETHIPVLAPLPIGFAVFIVHLATIPITGTGINPARSFGPAVIFNNSQVWDDQWIFWVGPLLGAAMAAAYHHGTTYFHPKKIVEAAAGQDIYRNVNNDNNET